MTFDPYEFIKDVLKPDEIEDPLQRAYAFLLGMRHAKDKGVEGLADWGAYFAGFTRAMRDVQRAA